MRQTLQVTKGYASTAAPALPYAPPSALGRIAATARRFNCASQTFSGIRATSAATNRPVTPTECAAGLRCALLVVLRISSVECPDMFQCVRICLPNAKCCLVEHARVPPKNQLPSVAFPCAAQACLHTTALKLRCVCHGSRRGMWRATGKATQVLGGGPGWAAPAAQRVHDRGGGRPRACCPFDRLAGASVLPF